MLEKNAKGTQKKLPSENYSETWNGVTEGSMGEKQCLGLDLQGITKTSWQVWGGSGRFRR